MICPKGQGCEARTRRSTASPSTAIPCRPRAPARSAICVEYGAALFWRVRLARGSPSRPRLRRHPRLQPAGPDLPRRRCRSSSSASASCSTITTSTPRFTRRSSASRGALWRLLASSSGSPSHCRRGRSPPTRATGDRHRARRQDARGQGLRRPLRAGVARCRRGPGEPERGARAPPICVGYVGVIGEQEGIDLLLEAVRHHRRRARPQRHPVRARRRRTAARRS